MVSGFKLKSSKCACKLVLPASLLILWCYSSESELYIFGNVSCFVVSRFTFFYFITVCLNYMYTLPCNIFCTLSYDFELHIHCVLLWHFYLHFTEMFHVRYNVFALIRLMTGHLTEIKLMYACFQPDWKLFQYDKLLIFSCMSVLLFL